MGNNTIKDAIARKNEQSPQYDYMWRVELPSLDPPVGASLGGIFDNLDTASRSNMSGNLGKIASGVGEFVQGLSGLVNGATTPMADLNHRVATFDTPFFQMDTKKITDRNSFWYAASNNDIGGINLTMDEFEDGATYRYLDAWKNLIINPDGTYNPPAAYKRTIKFIRMSATNLDLHIHYYEGYFISELSNIQNNYESNGVLQYSATLTGDNIRTVLIPEATVKQRVAAAETSIMLQDWANDKFRVDGWKGAEKIRMLGEVADLFR